MIRWTRRRGAALTLLLIAGLLLHTSLSPSLAGWQFVATRVAMVHAVAFAIYFWIHPDGGSIWSELWK